MALADLLPGRPKPAEVPTGVKQRIGRGRAAMLRDAPKRRLCMRFERGDTYWYVNGRGLLSFQNTVTNPDGSGKPPHRVRNSYNLIRPVIQGKVSAATQRTPSFQVLPSTTSQERVSAAELAEKVARYGYAQWRYGEAAQRAVNFAIGGGGEAFAMPYFDPNVGPYVQVTGEDGETYWQGEGEIKIVVLNANEVYWEPGCLFEESRWHAVERAVPVDDVREMPGFVGFEVTPDASTSDIPTDRRPSDQMVMKTEYYERPCPRYPLGRRLVIVNSRLAVPEEPYPLKDPDGNPVDEPALHRLAWDVDGGLDRDFGLTWQLIDSQRTLQDCLNKLVEWKNRCLNPQMVAHINALLSRPTDEPGAVLLYQGPEKPEWEKPMELPQSLFQLIDTIRQIMRLMAADDQAEASADLTNVAAKTLQQVLEQSMNRWQQFMARKAAWDARLMRHCLFLVCHYYTLPRLLKIKGRDGWERVPDFKGADLLGEVDVRVFPDSLIPQTRQGVQDQITWINANFPGWLQPQDALAALQEGSLDRLTESYWLDKARANEIIQRIRDGTVMDMPARSQTDPITGDPVVDPQTGEPMDVPGWMPDEQDSLPVWRKVLADWMKTDDYARQPPESQAVARQVWGGIQRLEQAKAARDAALQQQMAQDAGIKNAAAPQNPKAMPSLPGSRTPAPPT